MRSIDINDQVLGTLKKRTQETNRSLNEVLSDLLPLSPSIEKPSPIVIADSRPMSNSIIEFVRTESFQADRSAIGRYLKVLAWLYINRTLDFEDPALASYHGKRCYFSTRCEEVEQSGKDTDPQKIPNSPYWALTKLDNDIKRTRIKELMQVLKFSPGDINLALAELPKKGVRL